MSGYLEYISTINQVLEKLKVTDKNQKEISSDEGFINWCKKTEKLKNQKKTMYFIGNGASASMAAHMSADASKNGGFRCECFNESSLMTAIGNDISFEKIFSIPIERFGDAEDILVTISSSGNSPNIIAAIESAKKMGIFVITLSGLSNDNKSRQLGDLNFYVPGETYGIVEAAHQVLLHCWMDMFIEKEENK